MCCLWEDGQYHDGTNWLGDAALYVSLSDDQGQTWTESKRITFVNTPNAWATHPKTYASESRVHLVWTDSPEGPQGRQAAYYMTSPDGGAMWEDPEQIAIATEANPRNVHGQGVGGTETYAVALTSEADGLYYRRRDLAANQGQEGYSRAT